MSSREKKEKLLFINSATLARKRNIRRQDLSQILNIYYIIQRQPLQASYLGVLLTR